MTRRAHMFVRLVFSVAMTVVGLLAVATPAVAQSGRILGKVTDDEGVPVAGAVVEMAAASGLRAKHAKTDEKGEFIITGVAGGRYLVVVSKEGVGTAQTEAVVGIGGAATANVTLRRFVGAADGPCADKLAGRTFDENVSVAFAVNPALTRLGQWLAAVEQHIPGCVDRPATLVAGRSRQELETLLEDVAVLSAFLQRVAELEKQDPRAWQAARRAGTHVRSNEPRAAVELHARHLTIFDVEEVFHGNQTLKRGAVLHADIAALIGDDLGRRAVLVADGRHQGPVLGSVHWEFGRRLLDRVAPSPGDDADVLSWYRATSAHLFNAGSLNELPAHLNKARDVFPGRAVFLIDSARLHEKLASPAIQAAVEDLRASQVDAQVDSRPIELERAEQFLRQAADAAPDDADVRLRWGHVLGALGRHARAAAELHRAIDLKPDKPQRYLAELFLGREEHELGRRDEARRRFENAAAMYPNAQSPWLALSHLARQHGDRASALRALRRVAATRPSSVDGYDPRWFYHEPYLDDAEPLMDQMRTIGSPGR